MCAIIFVFFQKKVCTLIIYRFTPQTIIFVLIFWLRISLKVVQTPKTVSDHVITHIIDAIQTTHTFVLIPIKETVAFEF